MTETIAGRCHCGNLEYRLHTDRTLDEIVVRLCRCEFCQRHRPRYWSDPAGRLEVAIGRQAPVVRYRFGPGTADFVVCGGCGVYAFAVTEADGAHRAVVNLNLALGPDRRPPETFLEALEETASERNARRARNWTPVAAGWPPASP